MSKRIDLNCELIAGERDKAHDYLKELFSLPDYYGRNLDALYDCLTDLDRVFVGLWNANAIMSSDYGRKIVETIAEACRETGGGITWMDLSGIKPNI